MDGIQSLFQGLRFESIAVLLQWIIVRSCRIDVSLTLTEAMELLHLVSSECVMLVMLEEDDLYGDYGYWLRVYASICGKLGVSFQENGFAVEVVEEEMA